MKLLQIDSSVLGENSVSRKLTAAIVARQAALHPGLEVEQLDLGANPVPHYGAAHFTAMRLGQAPEDAAVQADLARGDGFIASLLAADIIVIGVPMYNFGMPTQLKAWADRVLVAGKTFSYSPEGPKGLVPAGKKVFFASASGGLYSEGNPGAAFQHQVSHLSALLGFIGLTDITIIRAEGLAIPDLRGPAIAKAEAEIAALT